MEDRFEHFSYALFELSRCWYKITGNEMKRYDLSGTHGYYLITLFRYPEGLTAANFCEILCYNFILVMFFPYYIMESL